jgi:two-component system response regulator HydG
MDVRDDLDPDVLPDLDAVKQAHVRHVLDACGGNRSAAARILGVDRKTLYRRIARLEASHG